MLPNIHQILHNIIRPIFRISLKICLGNVVKKSSYWVSVVRAYMYTLTYARHVLAVKVCHGQMRWREIWDNFAKKCRRWLN